MEILDHLDFLAQRGIPETVDTQDRQVFWPRHLFRLKALGEIPDSLDTMERWGLLEPLVPLEPRADQGKPVQA